jgi:RHS repeat-associated protein
MHVHITYNGTTLTWTITDTVTNATFTASAVANIPAIVGGNTAYVGLTGSTGTYTSTQYVSDWTYISGAATTYAAPPAFSPVAGTYSTAQTVSISDSTPGAVIHYTVDGSTPTVSSPVYTGAITVAATETLKAIAMAAGYYNSSVDSAAYTINLPVTVSVSPSSTTLYAGQPQQFTATVTNTSNTAVTWTISPAGTGMITAAGLYTAPANFTTQQTVIVTATSHADSTKSSSVPVTLSLTQCTSNGYNYGRLITVDHTKVPNTDQTNFPFLFNTIDPAFATTANGGHVTSSSGYDIIFTSDPAGQNELNFELEGYNPSTGQVIAWVRIPNLSHTADTVLYMFYGNSGVTTSQQNPQGVWDANYEAVYHLTNVSTGTATDSTTNAFNGTLTSISASPGEIAGAASFNGSSSDISTNYVQNSVTAYTIEAWINSTSTNASIVVDDRGSGAGHSLTFGMDGQGGCGSSSCGSSDGISSPAGKLLMGDDSNHIFIGAESNSAINDGTWHHVVGTWSASAGSNVTPSQFALYVDGAMVSSPGTIVIGSDTSPLSGLGGTLIGSGMGHYSGLMDEVRISNAVRSADWIASEYNNQSSPSTFYTLYLENGNEVVPAATSLYAGQSQQFLATGTCAVAISWSMTSGAQGTLTSSGLYTAPTNIATEQTVTIMANSQGIGDFTGTALVTLLPAPLNPKLTLAAATSSPYATGTAQTFVVTLTNESGTPIPGEVVAFTTVGANSNTANRTTDINGIASYTYTGANSGNDTIQASASPGGSQVTSNTVSVVWIVPVQSISTTTVVGQFFPHAIPDPLSDPYPFDISPTATPAFTQEFPSINFNPPAGAIPGNPGIGVSTHPFTDVTLDQNGNYAGTIVAEGNGYQAGTVGGPLGPFQAVFTGSYIVPREVDAYITVYVDNIFMLGIGGGATQLSGALNGAPAVTPFEQLPMMGASPTTNPIGGFTMTVHFPGPGTYPYELDYGECCGFGGVDTLSLMMMAGVPNPNGLAPGISPAGSLTLSPSSLQPLPVGGQQTFTVVAKDAAGNPVSNLSVGLVVNGADSLDLKAITNSTGTATFVYQNVNPGTASVQAVAFISGMLAYSNAVSVSWTLPPTPTSGTGGNGTLSISISAPNTVTLPNTPQLGGTVTDSALPQGDTITVNWSKVSGPGTVQFAPANQLATTASFSEPGNYVLQLNASDVDASGSAQISVTVNPAPDVTQGWIGSPTDGSTVSGVVPITLASGVNLASGTLVYYPANNSNNVTILNSNTTGTSQIGTLDTTNLPNGSYWIQLQSTQTSGASEYDLLMISVVGNNKPGRVTTSVTDLVVPATGLAINIQRNYDSLNAGTSGDFGYGWSLGTSVNLTVDPRGDVTLTLGGQRRTFYLTPQFEGFLPFYSVAFTPEPGFHGTLTDAAPGCADLFDYLVPDGSLWACVGGGFYNPPGYVYTDPSGTSYTISASGNLQSMLDKNGNGLSITPSGITSTTGLSVSFDRDSSGRIIEITDPQSNNYVYSYDENGNLASVNYPNTPQASTYTYDSNHLYLSGTDFRNNPLPTTSYYQSSINSNGQCEGDCDPNGLPLNGRLKSVTVSPDTSTTYTTSYAYDLRANTTTITYPTDPADGGGNVDTATMVYDSAGDLLTSTDPLGHTTTNAYDTNRNLISVTDPLNYITCNAYDANGNRTSVTLPQTGPSCSSIKNTTAYNQFSEPTSTTDELGNVRTFNYDANYNPQSVTDSLGTLAGFLFNPNGTLQAGAIGYDIAAQPSKASQFTYDANGNMAGRTDALGRTTSYTYDSLGHKITMVEPLLPGTSAPAATTNYTYDAFGNLTQTSAPLGRVTSSQYDGNGNKQWDIDARGYKTSYAYDGLNRLILTSYPDTNSSSRTYDFRGNIVTETDRAGHVTKYVYDLAGRETSVTQAYGTSNATTTGYAYDNDGRKITETDNAGHATGYTYDAAGDLMSISGPKGNFSYGYDNARNRTSMTDGNNYTTQYRYDARKRLTTTIYPDHTTKTNAYDDPGNLISVTDQAENVVAYTYDAANQLQTVVQENHPDNSHNTNVYGYDSLGDLAGLTDENGHTTQNAYNLLMEPASKILPDQTLTESRTYDAVGNLWTVTHFNGTTTTYTYDNLNRLLSRSTPGEPTVSFTYTATGKRQTMTDASGATNYGYDSMDRLTTKATPEGTLNYTYDAVGHLASMISSDQNVSVNYEYDTLNRLQHVVDSRLGTTTYAYDLANNVTTATYPNSFQSIYTYDELNRITAQASQVSGYTYQLGPTGNRTSASEYSGRQVTWSYDGIYRLTNESITNAPNNKDGTVAYGLDPVGNRQSENSSLSGVPSGSFGFNADDELSTESYDQDGNTLASGGKTFAYDSQNHLVSMGSTVGLVYDGDGNRVKKIASSGTTTYLVDDLNPTGYPQVVEELTNGAVSRTYTYGLQRISQYQQVSGAWTPSFYGYDGGGNVRQLTNSAGSITDTYDYDAFGNKINSTGTTPNNYLYRGEQYDSDLGLYYLRARYYNPLTGRFMSRDPDGGNLIDPISLHKYLYANGDPVNAQDPRGRGVAVESALLDAALISFQTVQAVLRVTAVYRTAFCTLGQALILIEMTGEGAGFIRPPEWVGTVLGAGWDWCEAIGW